MGEGQASRVQFQLPGQIYKDLQTPLLSSGSGAVGAARLLVPACLLAPPNLTHPAALLHAGLLLAMFTSAVGRAGQQTVAARQAPR